MSEPLEPEYTVTFTESQRRQVLKALDSRADYQKRSHLHVTFFRAPEEKRTKEIENHRAVLQAIEKMRAAGPDGR